MNLRDAAQQALEALEQSIPKGTPSDDYNDLGFTRHFAAIDALRAALAEPEHEIIQRMRKLKAEAEAEHRQALEQGKCPSCGQELPDELKTEYQVNHDLPMGCDHCNSPLWCGTKCSHCGKVWEWADGIQE